MIKNILAFFGFVFLTLVILLGVGALGLFYDTVGLVNIPKEMLHQLTVTAEGLLGEQPVSVSVAGSTTDRMPGDVMAEAEWSNPLDLLPVVPYVEPTAMPSPTPVPTATPVPPLDPVIYRTETTIRMKEYVKALEGWLTVNDRAAADHSLVEDGSWQREMTSALATVVEKADALAEVGPPPEEYAVMDALFERVQSESGEMQRNIEQGFADRDPALWTAAGESFARVKDYLTQAVNEMLNAGWTLE